MPEIPQPSNSPSIALKSLAPSYAEQQHGTYVAALTSVLREPSNFRNIALTGAYGTGKSSVLKRLGELDDFADRVLSLSLST
ncbi:MAG: hypothetical protein H7288_07460, partial [Kineosporiaceae bacterium]|nr:hypothetical protein [Aeromicrobium sp.]